MPQGRRTAGAPSWTARAESQALHEPGPLPMGPEIPPRDDRFSTGIKALGWRLHPGCAILGANAADHCSMGIESLVLPGFDASTGLFMVPWWAAAAIAAFLVV